MNMRSKSLSAALLACAALAGAPVAFAIQVANPADAPVPGGAPGEVAVTATVTSVKGNVAVHANEAAAFEPATVGMKLEQGAIIRTGLRSVVQFLIGKDEQITVDRLGEVTLLQAILNQGKAKTDLGMKYGRVRYDIQDTDLQHDSKVRSPGSTLAIRGTDVTYEDQAPWVPTAISREGRAEFRNFRRQAVAFGGRKRASVAADKQGPAQQALSTTKADPRGTFAGRTATEDELNLTIQPLGGADAVVQRAVQDVLRGFALGPNASAIGVVNGLGPLEFTLEWSSVGGNFGPTDLNLTITDPKGQVLSAANPIVGSGVDQGQHFGDDPGTRGIGGERAAWGEFFPAGKYTLRAVHAGGEDAQVTLTAFQGEGDLLKTTVLTPVEPQPPLVLKAGETYTATITPSNTTTAAQSPRAAAAASRQAERQQKQQQAAAQKAAKAPKSARVGKR
jgi:hypothetical protein